MTTNCITPTPDEQAILNRRPQELSFQPSLSCLICHCRLVRFVFGSSACARCEPGGLWSDALVAALGALPRCSSRGAR